MTKNLKLSTLLASLLTLLPLGSQAADGEINITGKTQPIPVTSPREPQVSRR